MPPDDAQDTPHAGRVIEDGVGMLLSRLPRWLGVSLAVHVPLFVVIAAAVVGGGESPAMWLLAHVVAGLCALVLMTVAADTASHLSPTVLLRGIVVALVITASLAAIVVPTAWLSASLGGARFAVVVVAVLVWLPLFVVVFPAPVLARREELDLRGVFVAAMELTRGHRTTVLVVVALLLGVDLAVERWISGAGADISTVQGRLWFAAIAMAAQSVVYGAAKAAVALSLVRSLGASTQTN